MSDIVARLRALVILDEVGSDNPLGRDAAAKIELLRARINTLTAALSAFQGDRETAPVCEEGDASLPE